MLSIDGGRVAQLHVICEIFWPFKLNKLHRLLNFLPLLELNLGARNGSLKRPLHALPHLAVLECQRRVQSRVLSLVMLIEVQTEAEKLQRLIPALGQLEEEGPHHVLVALAHYLELRLDRRQRGLREGPFPPPYRLLFLLRDPVVACPASPTKVFCFLHARLSFRGRRGVQPVRAI